MLLLKGRLLRKLRELWLACSVSALAISRQIKRILGTSAFSGPETSPLRVEDPVTAVLSLSVRCAIGPYEQWLALFNDVSCELDTLSRPGVARHMYLPSRNE